MMSNVSSEIPSVARIIQSERPSDVEDLAFRDRVRKDLGKVGQCFCDACSLVSLFNQFNGLQDICLGFTRTVSPLGPFFECRKNVETLLESLLIAWSCGTVDPASASPMLSTPRWKQRLRLSL